ncbi:SPASM domain-containing protein [Helicobacter cetorum]|uniref:SPASM domain-containing protein n=1 Tax=Helicobacter cetorum TaxID=138563 RepID=UPI000CF165E2|nr:SPASM domain-containing protein [Helicobacter cetorum]
MSLELFQKACEQVAPLTKMITLHVLGDPCKLKNLKLYLDVAKHFGLKIDLVTSGAYLYDFSLLLHQALWQVSISLDAGLDTANRLDKERYIERVLELCHYKFKVSSEVFLNLRIQNTTLKKHFPFIQRFLKAFNYVSLESLETQNRVRLFKKSFLNIQKTFEWPSLQTAPITHSQTTPQTPYCYGLIEQIAILASGVVVPCCMDTNATINLGTIQTTPLKTILNSPKAIAIKTHFLKNQAIEPLCQRCTYAKIRQQQHS